MHLFGLLHTAAGAGDAVNAKVKDREQIFELFVRDAITLWRSLGRAGIDFTLVCSEPDRIRPMLTRFGAHDVRTRRIRFQLEVPSGIRFYAAHHKLDLFRHLGALPESAYVGFVDLDVIALGEQPSELIRLIELGTPLVYDITDQVVPAFGRDVIVRDLEKLTGVASEGRWYGGELIAGRPWFFRELCGEIDRCYPTYVNEWRHLHHQGDEMVVSAAVEGLRSRGLELADAGPLGIARRYWSIPPRHPQPRLDENPPPFLLHLPADKKFLASLRAEEQVDAALFLAAYRRRLRRRAVPNLARGASRLLGRV